MFLSCSAGKNIDSSKDTGDTGWDTAEDVSGEPSYPINNNDNFQPTTDAYPSSDQINVQGWTLRNDLSDEFDEEGVEERFPMVDFA